VAIARAIVIEPPLILMDEPLSNLDAKLRIETRAEIRRIHRELGRATIYVTHDQDEALSLADRIVVMKDGVVQQIAPPPDVYLQPANLHVARFMGYRNVLELDVVGEEGDRVMLKGADLGLTGVRKQPLKNGRAAVAIRPEEIVMGDGPGGVNTINARVENVEYNGRDSLLDVVTASGTVLHVVPAADSRRRHCARACAGRARARLPRRIGGDVVHHRKRSACAFRSRTVPRVARRCVHAPAVRLSVPVRSRPVVRAEGRRVARQLQAFFHDRQPLANDLDDAQARVAGDIDKRRLRAAHRLQDAAGALSALGDDYFVIPITRHRADRRGMLTYFGLKDGCRSSCNSSICAMAYLSHAQLLGRIDLAGDLGFSLAFLLILSYITGIDPQLRAASTLGGPQGAVPAHLSAAARAGTGDVLARIQQAYCSRLPCCWFPAGPTRVISIAGTKRRSSSTTIRSPRRSR
jgi:energy-coupling factor transporter ATP-binding protein EcfA2